jgi:hypothetical protein
MREVNQAPKLAVASDQGVPKVVVLVVRPAPNLGAHQVVRARAKKAVSLAVDRGSRAASVSTNSRRGCRGSTRVSTGCKPVSTLLG